MNIFKQTLFLTLFVTPITQVSFAADMSSPPDSLVVDSSGSVGIGTSTPSFELHVRKTSKNMMLLENTGGSRQIRKLLKMSNQGPVGFTMEDRSLAKEWQFRSDGGGNFIINQPGHAGAELKIQDNGAMIVKGSVTANGILLTSSRASKTDFSGIKTSDVMKKLSKINIEEWRYKEADKNDRHISPMAEDFYTLFKLGPDNKHINPNDLASVALIAAQELQKRVDKAELANTEQNSQTSLLKSQASMFLSKTEKLEKENIELKERLIVLEKLVTNLASGEGVLPEMGRKLTSLK